MVKYMQLNCTVELAGSAGPMREYGMAYGDGRVESYIAAPNESAKFLIHLSTTGYIATGLAMWVFIDGELQCNRVRRSIRMPRKGIDAKLCEVSFTVHGSEGFGEDDFLYTRDWSFQMAEGGEIGQHTSPEATGTKLLGVNPFEDPVGTIRVVVLRCALTRNEKAWVDPFGAFANVAAIEEKLRKGSLQSPFAMFQPEGMSNEPAAGKTPSPSGNWLAGLQAPLGRRRSANQDISGFSGNRFWVAPNPENDPPLFPGPFKPDNAQSKHSADKEAKRAIQLSSEAAHLSDTRLGNDPFFLSLMEEHARFQEEQREKQAKERPERNTGLANVAASQQASGDSTHRTKVGPRFQLCRALRTPRYLDDGEQPYATFIFKYRSKAALNTRLGVKFQEEEKRGRYEGMSKEELIAKLMGASLNEDEATADQPAPGANDDWEAVSPDNGDDDWNSPGQNEPQKENWGGSQNGGDGGEQNDNSWGQNNDNNVPGRAGWIDDNNTDGGGGWKDNDNAPGGEDWNDDNGNQDQDNDDWNDAPGPSGGGRDRANGTDQEQRNDFWNKPTGEAAGSVPDPPRAWNSHSQNPEPYRTDRHWSHGPPPPLDAGDRPDHARTESDMRSDWAIRKMDKARRERSAGTKSNQQSAAWGMQRNEATPPWGGEHHDRPSHRHDGDAWNGSPLHDQSRGGGNGGRGNGDHWNSSPEGNVWNSETHRQPPPADRWADGNEDGYRNRRSEQPPDAPPPPENSHRSAGMQWLGNESQTAKGKEPLGAEASGGWAGDSGDPAPATRTKKKLPKDPYW